MAMVWDILSYENKSRSRDIEIPGIFKSNRFFENILGFLGIPENIPGFLRIQDDPKKSHLPKNPGILGF